MDKLVTLLELQQQIREADSIESFGHIAVNQTYKIVKYDEAIFWTCQSGRLRLNEISGNAALDASSHVAENIRRVIRKYLNQPGQEDYVVLIPAEDMAEIDSSGQESAGAIILYKTDQDGVLGGLFLRREKVFREVEKSVLEELAQTFSQMLALLTLRARGSFFRSLRGVPHWKKIIAAACVLLFFFPVRLSITAPAEIVARQAAVVTAPFNGTIEEIAVNPGQAVQEDDVLAEMDQTALKNKMDVARQELTVAQSSLSRLRREALGSPEKKAELNMLQSEIAAKRIEYDYARTRFEDSQIKSPRDGIAIFSDKNTLKGKPVKTGDVLMEVADPGQKELLIRVPVNAMLPITENSRADFFLNVAPLDRKQATLRAIGYQASPDPDGLLTYKLRASFDPEGKAVRIGWKGTAKIYADWTILGYAVLRRPLVALRRITGI